VASTRQTSATSQILARQVDANRHVRLTDFLRRPPREATCPSKPRRSWKPFTRDFRANDKFYVEAKKSYSDIATAGSRQRFFAAFSRCMELSSASGLGRLCSGTTLFTKKREEHKESNRSFPPISADK
jgi:hypothetical protein